MNYHQTNRSPLSLKCEINTMKINILPVLNYLFHVSPLEAIPNREYGCFLLTIQRTPESLNALGEIRRWLYFPLSLNERACAINGGESWERLDMQSDKVVGLKKGRENFSFPLFFGIHILHHFEEMLTSSVMSWKNRGKKSCQFCKNKFTFSPPNFDISKNIKI